MMKDVEKIGIYYMTRASQFANLTCAIECFEDDCEDQEVWEYLFEYALRKEEADNMFDLLDDKTIDMLAGLSVDVNKYLPNATLRNDDERNRNLLASDKKEES